MISSAVLQWIAAITMVIDHIGLFIFADRPEVAPMRLIGRISMPIFVFLLVEGFKHTKNRWHYFLRIFIFAFISQFPFEYLSMKVGISWTLNIMFALATSLLALCCAERGKWWWLGVVALTLIAEFGKMDYGAIVVLMAVGFYLSGTIFGKAKERPMRIFAYAGVLYSCMVLRFLIQGWFIQLMGVAALIPIAMYNGKKGHRMPRYFFYVFFPLHLFVIMAIRFTFGL